MSLIKKRWPLWVRVLASPLALTGLILSFPIFLVMVICGEGKSGDKLLEYFIEPS